MCEPSVQIHRNMKIHMEISKFLVSICNLGNCRCSTGKALQDKASGYFAGLSVQACSLASDMSLGAWNPRGKMTQFQISGESSAT